MLASLREQRSAKISWQRFKERRGAAHDVGALNQGTIGSLGARRSPAAEVVYVSLPPSMGAADAIHILRQDERSRW